MHLQFIFNIDKFKLFYIEHRGNHTEWFFSCSFIKAVAKQFTKITSKVGVFFFISKEISKNNKMECDIRNIQDFVQYNQLCVGKNE